MSIAKDKLMRYRLFVLPFALAGCGQSYMAWDETDYAVGELKSTPESAQYVDQQLQIQVSSLENSLRNFSNFFLFQDEEIRLPQRQILSSNQVVLNRHIFIDWSGPVEQLLVDISQLTGYRTQTIGATPVLPPLVTLHHHNIQLLDVIRDVALQIHQKADLVVYPDEQLIELRYK